jgi:hypothetical protein
MVLQPGSRFQQVADEESSARGPGGAGLAPGASPTRPLGFQQIGGGGAWGNTVPDADSDFRVSNRGRDSRPRPRNKLGAACAGSRSPGVSESTLPLARWWVVSTQWAPKVCESAGGPGPGPATVTRLDHADGNRTAPISSLRRFAGRSKFLPKVQGQIRSVQV